MKLQQRIDEAGLGITELSKLCKVSRSTIYSALKGNKVVTRGKEKFVLETPPLTLQSMLNSNIVSKLLKYVNKTTYDKIIAQRIVDRYKQRNDDQVLS